MSRSVIGKIHLVAGLAAFMLIITFWTSTVVSELFLGQAAVTSVKQAILWGMLLLLPAMAAVGGTGFRLGGKSTAPAIAAKRRRMPVIALNGILILVPSAFFLAARAVAGQFDAAFYAVQGVELAAGAANITLMALNIRDGFAMTRKRRSKTSLSRSTLTLGRDPASRPPSLPAQGAAWRRS
jgi:hypothetical protein